MYSIYYVKYLTLKHIILAFALFLSAIFVTNAQNINGISVTRKFRVVKDSPKTKANQGFCKKGDVDYEGLVKAFGKPTGHSGLELSRKPMSEIAELDLWWNNYPHTLYLFYEREDGVKDVIAVHDYELDYFEIRTDRFLVGTDLIPGGLRVGDPVDKFISQYKPADQLESISLLNDNDDPRVVVYFGDCFALCIPYTDGVITGIYYEEID